MPILRRLTEWRLHFILLGFTIVLTGCCHPSVTAVSLSNPSEPCGIPFYLPKPLLIIAKNVRNIEDAKVGLYDSVPIPNYFDDQAKYADLNARTSWTPVGGTSTGQQVAQTSGASSFPTGVTGTLATNSPPRTFAGGAPVTPGTAPPDGLMPETFYTYQIVFVPDLTQKYGLRIRGGVGEIRAAMQLVNGWQFTGLGPFYMKDSSTAQNTLAAGIAANLAASGAADVISSVAGLGGKPGKPTGATVTPAQVTEVFEKIESLGPLRPVRLDGYAEIHVFEPYLTSENTMEWRPVTDLSFFRDYLGTKATTTKYAPQPAATTSAAPSGKPTGAITNLDELKAEVERLQKQVAQPDEGSGPDPALARAVAAKVLGLPSFAIPGGGPTAATVTAPGGGASQINVNQCCPGPGCAKTTCNHPILEAVGAKLAKKWRRPQVGQQIIQAEGDLGMSTYTGTSTQQVIPSVDVTKEKVPPAPGAPPATKPPVP